MTSQAEKQAEGRAVGVLGGSFNPIHNGHIAIAEGVLKSGMVSEVWLMVSPRNPLKQESELMSDQERLDKVRRAVSGLPCIEACDVEFRLPKPSYTYLTMRHLREAFPHNSFALIIGADNWERFALWRNHEELLQNHRIIVYPRKGSKVNTNELPQNVRYLDLPLLDISSTQVRKLISRGEDVSSLVPQAF